MAKSNIPVITDDSVLNLEALKEFFGMEKDWLLKHVIEREDDLSLVVARFGGGKRVTAVSTTGRNLRLFIDRLIRNEVDLYHSNEDE